MERVEVDMGSRWRVGFTAKKLCLCHSGVRVVGVRMRMLLKYRRHGGYFLALSV